MVIYFFSFLLFIYPFFILYFFSLLFIYFHRLTK